MPDVRCTVTELLARDCAHCRNLPDPDHDTPVALGHAFVATYRGRCAACGEWFNRGDRIALADASGYVGPCCQEEDRD